MEICELTDKEFRITFLLKNGTELQERTDI